MLKAAVRNLLDQLIRIPGCRRHLESRLGSCTRCDHLMRNPAITFAPPGHFYSPLPDLGKVVADADRIYREGRIEDGLGLSLDAQLQLAAAFSRYQDDFPWKSEPQTHLRYPLRNPFFAAGDACALYSMMRHFRPRRIIEIGSGYSSALMLDTVDLFLDGQVDICFIEPFTDRLESLLRERDNERVRIIRSPVQEISDAVFEPLEENDILFIDSSHVARAGSDVNHLMFSVLPRLRSGVLIHIHDIFYPMEYPLEWFREGRCWNELYVVRAFMLFNRDFETLFFNSYLWDKAAAEVAGLLPPFADGAGASLWLRRL